MNENFLNENILLKKYIFQKEYNDINELQNLCSTEDNVNLKLELDYRINASKDSEIGLKNINEFLYYIDDILVSYLSISSFGRNIGEINGMTHPNFRKKGLFTKLFELAIDECKKRKFSKTLLLSDGKSNLGIEFIQNSNGKYEFSEYRMKLINRVSLEEAKVITLRPSTLSDKYEIARQNALFWGTEGEIEIFEEDDEVSNIITYIIELNKEVIGKIKVEYIDNSAFICGFGILPDFRGKGYGKASLKETLNLIYDRNIFDIELDVECKNNTALNLYKSCGFEEKSVMNYYSIDI